MANGLSHHSQGHRPWNPNPNTNRLANGHGQNDIEYGRWPNAKTTSRNPGAMPLAMMCLAVGQFRVGFTRDQNHGEPLR